MNNLITMVCSLKNIKIPYGVVEINDKGEIENIKEKPELVYFVNTGLYFAEPKIIEELEENRPVEFRTSSRNTNPGEKKSVSIQ